MLIQAPHATAVSGGWCLASMTGAGWFRSTAMNILVELVLAIDQEMGAPPLILSSNSGGSMFSTRFFVFKESSLSSQWTYPCFLLSTSFHEACFFHHEFGSMSSECDSSIFNAMFSIISLIYSPATEQYGGPNGVLYSFLSVYYPFCSDVPIADSAQKLDAYWKRYGLWNRLLSKHSTWGLAVSVVQGDHSFEGKESLSMSLGNYLPRGLYSLTPNAWFFNETIYKVASYSANTLTLSIMMPFGYPPSSSSTLGSMFHLFHIAFGFFQVQRLKAAHQIVNTPKIKGCEAFGCPILDGCATDNGPTTQGISETSKEPENLRFRQLSLIGPASTLVSIKYILGQGGMSLETLGGLNACPLAEPEACELVSTIRKLVVPVLPEDEGKSYRKIASQYLLWRPSHQVLSSYCGDPLVFDIFVGMCSVESLCHLWVDVVSGVVTGIRFMVSTLVLVMSMLWLSPNPLSARYVEGFVPTSMLQIPYYSHMKSWFPNYAGTAEQKGGIGFTKPAGHSLLDLLTWLSTRLLNALVLVFRYARHVYMGVKLRCGWNIYKDASTFNAAEFHATNL